MELYLRDLDLDEACGNCGDVFDVHVIAVEHRTRRVDTDTDLACGPWETALSSSEDEEPLPEFPDKIYVWEYAHKSNDEFSEWEMWLDENTTWDKYGSQAASRLHYRLYEIDVFLEINLYTGNTVPMIIKCEGETFYHERYNKETMTEFPWA